MLANYENTKKMVMQLGSSTLEVRKEHKNIKKEMMVMSAMIQPAIKETQKSVRYCFVSVYSCFYMSVRVSICKQRLHL